MLNRPLTPKRANTPTIQLRTRRATRIIAAHSFGNARPHGEQAEFSASEELPWMIVGATRCDFNGPFQNPDNLGLLGCD